MCLTWLNSYETNEMNWRQALVPWSTVLCFHSSISIRKLHNCCRAQRKCKTHWSFIGWFIEVRPGGWTRRRINVSLISTERAQQACCLYKLVKEYIINTHQFPRRQSPVPVMELGRGARGRLPGPCNYFHSLHHNVKFSPSLATVRHHAFSEPWGHLGQQHEPYYGTTSKMLLPKTDKIYWLSLYFLFLNIDH